jgi:hypothetical protein
LLFAFCFFAFFYAFDCRLHSAVHSEKANVFCLFLVFFLFN